LQIPQSLLEHWYFSFAEKSHPALQVFCSLLHHFSRAIKAMNITALSNNS
jgi:hypothetical protein